MEDVMSAQQEKMSRRLWKIAIKYLNIPTSGLLQHAATRCNTLQHAATRCNTLQHAVTRCNTLHHAESCCNTLLHAAMTDVKIVQS